MNVQVVTMVMLVVLGALGLIAHGTITLFTHNSRNDEVDNFKEKMKAFKADTLPKMRETLITLDTHNDLQMQLVEKKIKIEGSEEGLDEEDLTTYHFEATLTPRPQIEATATTSNGTGQESQMDFGSLAVTLNTLMGMECVKQVATSRCGGSQCCSRTDMEDFCARLAEPLKKSNFTANDKINDCRVSDLCGTCEWGGFVNERCQMMRWNSDAGWEYDSGNRSQGCKFPFLTTNNEMTEDPPDPLAQLFTLRSSDDPYVWLNNETKGEMSFGTTESEQRKAALIMIGAGTAVLVVGGVAIGAHTANKMRYEKMVAERRKRRQKEIEEKKALENKKRLDELDKEIEEAAEEEEEEPEPEQEETKKSRKESKKARKEAKAREKEEAPKQPLLNEPPPPPPSRGRDYDDYEGYDYDDGYGRGRGGRGRGGRGRGGRGGSGYNSPTRRNGPRFQQQHRRYDDHDHSYDHHDDGYSDRGRGHYSPSNRSSAGGGGGGGGGGRRWGSSPGSSRRSGAGSLRDGSYTIDFGSATSTPAASSLGSSGGRRYAPRHGGGGGGGYNRSLDATPHDMGLPGRNRSSASSNFSGNSVDLDSLPMPNRGGRPAARQGRMVTKKVSKRGGYVDDEDL